MCRLGSAGLEAVIAVLRYCWRCLQSHDDAAGECRVTPEEQRRQLEEVELRGRVDRVERANIALYRSLHPRRR